MKRWKPVRILSPLVLTFALAAGCDSPTGGGDAALRAPVARSLSAAPGVSGAPVSTVTPLEGGGFRFTSTAVLDAPQGAVWAKIHNIEKVLEIALPGIASDFRWVDGGSPGRVPSRYQFSALGSSVLEEVFFVDRSDKVLRYRLVTPALGIRSYVATMALDPVDNRRTTLSFSRDLVFDDPASVDAFAALFEQEIAALQSYFADRGH
jgi:hypothetical protein